MAQQNNFKQSKSCKKRYKQRINAGSIASDKMARIVHGKRWYNSKIFVNFVDFSCEIFWAQNVSMPPDKNFPVPIDPNALILLVSNICNGNV